MVSKTKLYRQLDSLEEELRERIIPHLEDAASGRNDYIFCTTDFNSIVDLKSKIDKETDSLIQLGRQVLALREKLGEPDDGTIAERICWYCRKWSEGTNNHKNTAQDLAKSFLSEINA